MSSVLYTIGMSESTSSSASARRHLLPRSPSDRAVVTLLAVGVLVALVADVDPVIGLAPGAIATVVQKVRGHLLAWRSGGVERAFVMESTAISFYVIVAGLVAVAGLQAAGAFDRIDLAWLPIAAMFIDTTVRSTRESRFV
jgi:hypothetical protein